MKNVCIWAVALSGLVACQQNEGLEDNVFDSSLKVVAEIASNASSRTTTQRDGKVSFKENDKIGFYMPEAETSGLWTYDGDVWNSSIHYQWKDKVNDYTFCAYYPFTEEASRTQIPMPDLTKQNGTWEQIGMYDFLAARCTTNYSENKGVVSFTGDEAFKHQYALVSVTIKKDKEAEEVVLSNLKFEAPGLTTSHTYHFGTSGKEDGVTVNGEEVNVLEYKNLSDEVSMEGYNKVVVINPLMLEEPVNFSIQYARDGIKYNASSTALGSELKKGYFYNLTLRLKKAGLVVEGKTIEDWNVIPMQDVEVEENPVEAN